MVVYRDKYHYMIIRDTSMNQTSSHECEVSLDKNTFLPVWRQNKLRNWTKIKLSPHFKGKTKTKKKEKKREKRAT